MRWFDDLWLKEGFAEFMAYKTLEKVMPDANAWKVFYERNKQAAYATDSTKGTTPIYQKIDNLSAAKSAYGNIVYRKAPSFLRQAEFYLGEDKFQTAARAFLKKHEFANAGWEDLVKEFEGARGTELKDWAKDWVTKPGLTKIRISIVQGDHFTNMTNIPPKPISEASYLAIVEPTFGDVGNVEESTFRTLFVDKDGGRTTQDFTRIIRRLTANNSEVRLGMFTHKLPILIFPNYQDYGYGIFLLDDKSREYVLKNIQNEKDPFLRSMMWERCGTASARPSLIRRFMLSSRYRIWAALGVPALAGPPRVRSRLKAGLQAKPTRPSSSRSSVASVQR